DVGGRQDDPRVHALDGRGAGGEAQPRGAVRGEELDPAPAVAEREVRPLLEAERLVEGDGAIRVGRRDRDEVDAADEVGGGHARWDSGRPRNSSEQRALRGRGWRWRGGGPA